MAKGDWWFKFEIPAWRNSPELRRCSLEAKGFWIECIAIMRDLGVPAIRGTVDEIARSVGCFPDEAGRCIEELKRTGTADVMLRNGEVTLKSRKFAKELKAKELNRLRVQKHRGKQDVMPEKRPLEKSNQKEERKDLNTHTHTARRDSSSFVQAYLDAFPDEQLSAFQRDQIAGRARNGAKWKQTIEFWLANKHIAKNVGNMLNYYDELVEGKKNGTNKPNRNGFAKRTDQDVIEESADFYRNYPN